MDLERKYVSLNRRKGKALSQITLEEDLNVPDQKPDIFRIIHRQGDFRPDEVKGENGKVKVRGVFLYRILYLAENSDRSPECLEGSIPVDEVVFLNEMEEGDMLDFRWSLEDLHASAIHSRKANMKCILSLEAEAFREQPAVMVERPEDSADLYAKTCPVHLQQEVIHKKDTLRVKEEINLPPGRPNIRRIIWKEMRLQGTETRRDEGRLLVKGELMVFFLYESEEDEGRLQWMEQSVPFHSEVACDACHADLTGRTEVTLQRGEMDLQPDYDGEPRMVRVDAVLELLLRYYEERNCEALCDAYSLAKEIRMKQKSYTWDHVPQVSDSRARVSGRMKLSDTEPGILQVLSSGMQIHSDHTERTESGLLIQGTAELWVLYAASDDSLPMACTTRGFPFEHTIEMQEMGDNISWQIFLCPDQLTVSMLDAQELEMKAVLKIQVLFQEQSEVTLAEDIEEEPLDMERLKNMPGMVIHIVQPDETLWDISKAHATTCEAVMELNELKDETLKAGQKVLLVKEVGR